MSRPGDEAYRGYRKLGREAHENWTEADKYNSTRYPQPQPPYLPHDPRYQGWVDGWRDGEDSSKRS